MYLQILLAIALGTITGTITGLIPGIHVNLIAVLIISLTLPLQPIVLAIFILSVAITHSFLDSIPSIYLGAPDEAQALNVLPGHRLLHQGLGHQAITYTLLGSFGSLIICVIFFPLFIKIIKFIYPYLKPIISVFNFEYFSTRYSSSSFVLPYGFIGFLSASSVIGVFDL